MTLRPPSLDMVDDIKQLTPQLCQTITIEIVQTTAADAASRIITTQSAGLHQQIKKHVNVWQVPADERQQKHAVKTVTQEVIPDEAQVQILETAEDEEAILPEMAQTTIDNEFNI